MIKLTGNEARLNDIDSVKNYTDIRSRVAWGPGSGIDKYMYPGLTLTNKSNASPNVELYSVSDPILTPPAGELYGIETELGSNKVPPRQQGARLIRHYTDTLQTDWQSRIYDRSEVHFGAENFGETLSYKEDYWIGWSELYKSIDASRVTTVMQFRGQLSTAEINAQAGITVDTNSDEYKQAFDSGPCLGLEVVSRSGVAYHSVAVRTGNTQSWSVALQQDVAEPLELNQWYDVVFHIRQSADSDGVLRAWIGKKNTLDFNAPLVERYARNEYTFPVINGVQIVPVPRFRWGLYRYGCKSDYQANGYPLITENDRYMEKYSGNLRIVKGASDSNFDLVKPRDY